MLASPTASESSSYSAAEYGIQYAQVDLQLALLDAEPSSLLREMLHFLAMDLM